MGNNGKVFKIKRSFLQIEETTPGSLGAADSFDFADGKGHSTQIGVSTLVISAGAGTCAAHIAPDASTVGDVSLPFNRKITGISTTDSGTTTQGHGGIAGDAAIDAVVDTNANANCAYSVRRYVITLDSMPTESLTDVKKTLLYKSWCMRWKEWIVRLLRGILWRIVSDPNRLGLKEDIIIAWTAKFIMWFWQRMSQPKKHHYMPHWQTGEVCRLFVVHT